MYFKWHAGPWRGHYVYWYMRPVDSWTLSIQAIVDRIGEVYGGRRKPLKDTPRPS